jgi:hypothetical protein
VNAELHGKEKQKNIKVSRKQIKDIKIVFNYELPNGIYSLVANHHANMPINFTFELRKQALEYLN